MKKIFILCAFLPLLAHAEQGVEILKTRKLAFRNRNCATTDSCALRKVEAKVTDQRIDFGDGNPTYSTSMYVKYKTRTTADLEKFAVVQFIRGCHFNTTRNPDGTVTKDEGILSREFFDDRVRFRHPKWVVDSVDVDPMYNNVRAGDLERFKSRHGLYRSNSVAGSFDSATESYYYDKTPERPELYTSDSPSGVFRSSLGEGNMSLEFKTCIFHTGDLPIVAKPSEMNPRDAITCFRWSAKWTFNYATNSYERGPRGIDSYCQND